MAEDKNELLSAEDFGLTGLDDDDIGGGSQSDVDSLLAGLEGGGGESHEPSDSSLDLFGGGGGGKSKKKGGIDYNGGPNIKMILDVPLRVSVELGRTKMLVNDLLQLGQGSVIELDKMAGEPMEILVNDKLVALGEVVVINERFGVRLTDVVSNLGLDTSSDSVA